MHTDLCLPAFRHALARHTNVNRYGRTCRCGVTQAWRVSGDRPSKRCVVRRRSHTQNDTATHLASELLLRTQRIVAAQRALGLCCHRLTELQGAAAAGTLAGLLEGPVAAMRPGLRHHTHNLHSRDTWRGGHISTSCAAHRATRAIVTVTADQPTN